MDGDRVRGNVRSIVPALESLAGLVKERISYFSAQEDDYLKANAAELIGRIETLKEKLNYIQTVCSEIEAALK